MRRLLLIAAFFVSLNGSSQNAYYDMLQLVKWSKLPDSVSEKRANAQAMLIKLLKYSGGSSRKYRDSANTYPALVGIFTKADSLYSFTKRYDIPRSTILYTITHTNFTNIRHEIETGAGAKKEENLTSLKKLTDAVYIRFKRISNLYQHLIDIRKIYQSYNGVARKAQVRDFTTRTIILVDSLIKFGVENIDTSTARPDSFNTPLVLQELTHAQEGPGENIRLAAIGLDTVLANWLNGVGLLLQQNLAKSEEELYQETMRLPSFAFRRIFSSQMNLQPEEEIRRTENEEKYLYAKATVEEAKFATAAGSSQQLTDFNFPTESQIIDAIAVYLARRTKQEAALFFIESLGRALKSNDLARELFPKTAKLMLNQQSYESARFGAKWREAISTDYISLPENIMRSQFIEKRFAQKEVKNYFHDAVVFAGYVGKKYSFVDVLRTLFSDSSKLNGHWTKVGVNVLHIINQEFYDTSKQRYWISPQAFFDLDTQQIRPLYELVRIKYEDKVPGVMKAIFGQSFSQAKADSAVRFYTELLTILQQFHAAQATPIKNADGTIIIQDGFWDTQRNLIDLLLNQGFVRLSPKERQFLGICHQTFYIYDYLSNKNYIAASNHVLDIIGTLTNQSPRTLINLSSDQMKNIRQHASYLEAAINRSNAMFDAIQVIKQMETLAESIKNDSITRVLMTSVIDTSGNENLVLDSLFAQTDIYAKNDFVTKLAALQGRFAARLAADFDMLQENYDTIKAVKAQIADLRSGKITYKNTKALLNNLQNAGYAFSLQNNRYFQWLTNFSELLTEIALAKDNEALANIIESYALPPGSYRQKRNTSVSIDLNAYVGGFVGSEKISGQNTRGAVYGLTAPIGLSFSWSPPAKVKSTTDEQGLYINRNGKLKRRSQNSWTLDFTIVDIGAVVSYRLGNGTEKGLPSEVRWRQLMAFGMNIRRGIKGTPLCVGVGYQNSPELRTIGRSQENANRFHFTVAFDLPLLNLYRPR